MLCIDLFCGLGGWAEGFLSEGYDVIGFDIERHDYGTGGYPGQLVLQDVTTLHGSQFRNATVIVASPPCQAYSYMAMPWKRAKAIASAIKSDPDHALPMLNTLFDSCFRIQREASEAAARYIPLVVENVRGAEKWVGGAGWHHGSYYLWGDIPALMPITLNGRLKFPAGCGPRLWKDRDIPRLNDGESLLKPEARKRPGQTISAGFNDWPKDENGAYVMPDGTKIGGDYFSDPQSPTSPRRAGSRTLARKAASAQIAKIPFPLAQHIARVFKS